MEMVAKVQAIESLDIKKLLANAHEELFELCDNLEAIADSLPNNINQHICNNVAKKLPRAIEVAHRLEEGVLFPLLEKSKTIVVDIRATIDRLKHEHFGDKYFAEDLAEVLMSYGAGKPILDAEATGYMLRGFFEALRRHLAFESELFASVL